MRRASLFGLAVLLVVGGAWIAHAATRLSPPRRSGVVPPEGEQLPAEAAADTARPADAGRLPDAAPAAAPDDGASPALAEGSDAPPPGSAGPSLIGMLVIPAGFDSTQFRVTYRRSTRGNPLPIHLSPNGRFRLFHAAPGSVMVFVHLLGDPSPLRVVPDVVLPCGPPRPDPRLQSIEFPELRLAALAVVGDEGKRLEAPVAVLVLPPRGDNGRRYAFAAGAEVKVPARERPQRLQVWSPGRAAVEVEVHDEATVHLPPPAVVVLEVVAEPEVCERDFVEATLEPVWVEAPAHAPLLSEHDDKPKVTDGHVADVAVERGHVAVHALRHRDSGTIRCALSGRYRVVWEARSAGVAPARGEGPTLDVEVGESYEVRVEVTRAAVAAARR